MPTTIGTATTFITYSRGTLATVTDVDGKVKWGPHNLVLNSASPATQDITTIVGAKYKVEITGTGSVALSGAGTGTASSGSPAEITASTTTLTLTVSGTVATMWAYRSDLGGMQLNKAGSTYNATTGTVFYGPRLNYRNAAPLGLLVEEQRTNLALHSSDLTNAAWTATNVTTAKTATGPDGIANSATTLTASAVNGTVLQAITSASAERITSVYIKRRTGTGAIQLTQNNGSTWTAVTVTADWTRVNIPAATLTNPTIGIRITTSGDAVDVFNFQHELGAFATSAIPTFGATVQRNADLAYLDTAQFPYSNTEGSIIVDFDTIDSSPSSVFRRPFTLDGGGAYQIGATYVFDNGVYRVTVDEGASPRSAVAFKANDFAVVINGGTPATGTGAFGGSSYNRLTIGNSFNTSNFINGHVRRLTYIPRRLTNAELIARTA